MKDSFGLTEIVVPSLMSTSYGKDLREQFENIDNNFKILANREFVKGDDGKSVITKNVEFSNDPVLMNSIIKCIVDYSEGEINLTTLEGSIVCMYDIDGNLINTTPYIYIDKRFRINNPIDLDGKTDCTCVVIYNGETFEAVSTFPTLYYDRTKNVLCWKIDGINTGIIAQGPKGIDGKTGEVVMVRVEDTPYIGNEIYKITEIFYENDYDIDESNKDPYIDIEEWEKISKENILRSGVIAIVRKKDVFETYWIANVFMDIDANNNQSVPCVRLNKDTEITTPFTLKILKDTLLGMNSNKDLNGLFVPFSDNRGGHMYKNSENDNLEISPLSDIDDNDIVDKDIILNYNELYVGGEGVINKINKLNTSINDRIDDINEELSNTNDKINTLNEEIIDINSDIVNIKDSLDDITGGISLEDLKKDVESIKSDIISINGDITTINGNIDDINKSIESNLIKIVSNSTSIANNSRNISNLESDMSNLRGYIIKDINNSNDLSLFDIPVSHSYVICNINYAGSLNNMILSSVPDKLTDIHVIFNNKTESTVTIAIPNSDKASNSIIYKNLTEEVFTISPGEVCEVNFIIIKEGSYHTAYIRSV